MLTHGRHREVKVTVLNLLSFRKIPTKAWTGRVLGLQELQEPMRLEGVWNSKQPATAPVPTRRREWGEPAPPDVQTHFGAIEVWDTVVGHGVPRTARDPKQA